MPGQGPPGSSMNTSRPLSVPPPSHCPDPTLPLPPGPQPSLPPLESPAPARPSAEQSLLSEETTPCGAHCWGGRLASDQTRSCSNKRPIPSACRSKSLQPCDAESQRAVNLSRVSPDQKPGRTGDGGPQAGPRVLVGGLVGQP